MESEKDLQKLCETWLKKAGIEYLHLPKTINRGRQYINNLKGFPDFAIFRGNGNVIFIELKINDGRLRIDQYDFFEKMLKKRYICKCVNNINDFIGVVTDEQY